MTDGAGDIGGIIGAGAGLVVGAIVIDSVGNMMLKAAKKEGEMFKKKKKGKKKSVSIY